MTPTAVRGWSPWMEWLPTLVSTSTSSMPATTAPPSSTAGPNESVFQTPSATSCAAVVVVSS